MDGVGNIGTYLSDVTDVPDAPLEQPLSGHQVNGGAMETFDEVLIELFYQIKFSLQLKD